MNIKEALGHVVLRKDLTAEQMQSVMQQIMTGEASDAQIGGFLVGMRMKGETINEIVGAARVMRDLAKPVHISDPHLVDTCGTGGDGSNLFNVSTASAFVAAAAGAHVAKHGNRGVSSRSGSADLLEAAGIDLDLPPESTARAIREIGVGFLFAPAHHAAMRYAIAPRKEMAIRTLFNLLGPLTNPAQVKKQVLGVFDRDLCPTLAHVLKELGSEHVLVVHSEDGLDEFSLAAPSYYAELRNGEVTEHQVSPEDLGLKSISLQGLQVDSADESLSLIQRALGKDHDAISEAARDLIALNAGAAIYAADLANSFKEGVEQALDAIGSGLALAKIQELASFTHLQDEA